MQAIRTHDLDWLVRPTPDGRPTQLGLLLAGLPMPQAQPLDKRTDRSSEPTRPPSWIERTRATAQPAYDLQVCPPALRGQQVLFRLPRQLTDAHTRGISGRDLRDNPLVQTTAAAYAAERHYSPEWQRWVCRMLGLALAIRDADGDDLVREEALDDLPHFADAAAEVLRRAGLLRPRPAHRPAATAPQPRSCRHCGSWGFRALCQGCRHWTLEHQAGTCRRCRRAGLPVGDGDGLCRGCRLHVAEHGPQALAEPCTQLWFGGTLALTLRAASRSLGYRPLGRRARLRLQAQRPARPVSRHLVDPNQGTLVAMPRDWRRIDTQALPALTPAAERLLEAFKQRSRAQAWDDGIRGEATRALHLLLAWLGAAAPIPEADIRSIPTARRWTSSRRVLRFLEEHDLVVPDPARQVDVDQHAVEQRLQTLPDGIAGELRRWVQVLRGQGRRQHRPMGFSTIRKYVGYADPVVQAWATRVSSLREITPDDIRAVLRERQGNQARSVHVSLRSLFQALKQEQLVFRDPTRGIALIKVERLPAPLPSDRLRGLLDQADGAMARLAVGLIAIHALRNVELIKLRLHDLDLARGRLTVHRGTSRHTVYLDGLTHRLAVAWLRERQRRWPYTSNSYLLVSQQTAVDPSHPPVTLAVIDQCFRPLGITPSQLRADRILDEARHTADPVRLMRVFGISDTTAMKYLYTAHPERQSVPS
ncbi:MAG TPA: hypothetical protein VG276_29110 [Actinomycetes bacterium]|nr:hypothetical protein [Actinomycetes bacterium]